MRSFARWIVVSACLSSSAAMADGWPERVLSDATRGTAEQLRLTTRDEVVAMNVLTDDGNRKSREHPVDLGAAPSREGDAPGNGVRIVDTNPAGATTW